MGALHAILNKVLHRMWRKAMRRTALLSLLENGLGECQRETIESFSRFIPKIRVLQSVLQLIE